MSDAQSRLFTVGALIGAAFVLLVALAPTLLFGESLSAMSLILTGAGVLGAGLLVRWVGRTGVRTLGSVLAAIGVVILAVGVLALLVAVWGRGY